MQCLCVEKRNKGTGTNINLCVRISKIRSTLTSSLIPTYLGMSKMYLLGYVLLYFGVVGCLSGRNIVSRTKDSFPDVDSQRPIVSWPIIKKQYVGSRAIDRQTIHRQTIHRQTIHRNSKKDDWPTDDSPTDDSPTDDSPTFYNTELL
jgi:hypothetical protein